MWEAESELWLAGPLYTCLCLSFNDIKVCLCAYVLGCIFVCTSVPSMSHGSMCVYVCECRLALLILSNSWTPGNLLAACSKEWDLNYSLFHSEEGCFFYSWLLLSKLNSVWLHLFRLEDILKILKNRF